MVKNLKKKKKKNLPAMQETWVQSLCWEDPLEEGMATHSSIPAGRIPMERGAWQVTVHRVAKNGTRLKRLSTPAHGYKCEKISTCEM